MAKSPNSKLKLLYLRDYLLENTDEDHSVTLEDVQEHLEQYDIAVERKTFYDDIRILREYGMDILQENGRYSVGMRDFEPQEVRLLVDMVQSSNSITRTKTNQLIDKLKSLASVHEGKKLSRQVYVRNRVKAMNESVYYNVDKISEAISTDKAITFQYFRYNAQKKKELRHNGKVHRVSPFALIWVDQNYYMLAYDPEHDEMRHYRVDRMTRIGITGDRRSGKALFEATDMSTYTTKVFHMFTGTEYKVRMRFASYLADAVIDRFGESVILVPDGDDHFTVTADIVSSRQFYAWMFGYGSDAEILFPPEVRDGMKDYLQTVLELYK